MLDIGTLRVNDRVRLLRPISGRNAGAVGKVIQTLTAHENQGKVVPAVIVQWQSPPGGKSPVNASEWDGFTQHEQAMHEMLERVDVQKQAGKEGPKPDRPRMSAEGLPPSV